MDLRQTRWFPPYGTCRTREIEHADAEEGPLTLIPSVGQPSGGISETVADATTNQTITEENKAPVSNFYRSRVPRVSD
jgi:hypothetical protein